MDTPVAKNRQHYNYNKKSKAALGQNKVLLFTIEGMLIHATAYDHSCGTVK